MDHERTQIVLGEAERTGILRFVLEGEGFDIVGLASSDEELERVLAGARPSVIVLDGGISATAALEAKERVSGASLVVVWPAGVAAVLAEEQVDPQLVIEDLGEAVRRASRRAEVRTSPILVPDLPDVASPIEERHVAPARWGNDFPPEPVRPGRNRSRVLVAVATWTMVLTTLTTIAVAVPNALDLFAGDRAPRRSSSPAQTRRTDDKAVGMLTPPGPTSSPTGSEQVGEKSGPASCEAPQDVGRADQSRDGATHPVRANGCPRGRGDGNRGQDGGGKPDDSGSRANEDKDAKDAKDKENHGRGGGTENREEQESGGSGVEHRPEIDHVRDAGRSDNANPG